MPFRNSTLFVSCYSSVPNMHQVCGEAEVPFPVSMVSITLPMNNVSRTEQFWPVELYLYMYIVAKGVCWE